MPDTFPPSCQFRLLDLDCEGQNNNGTVRSFDLDGYCFSNFHLQPPDYRLTVSIPFAGSVWRNLAIGIANQTEKQVVLNPVGDTYRSGFCCQRSELNYKTIH
ncbi:MAG: hypothetical protein IJI57_05560 [Flexilinea sp.]|nr:hypothetical protein [Flexilinea sp.]